jgi:hypothetical protein
MVAPSVVQRIPDLSQRCKFEEPSTEELMRSLHNRLRWVGCMQRCNSIPFHGSPLEINKYDGFAIVPSDGKFDLDSLRDSLGKSLESLDRLKSIAPNPQAQQKHQRAIGWLSQVHADWKGAIFRREELKQRQSHGS